MVVYLVAPKRITAYLHVQCVMIKYASSSMLVHLKQFLCVVSIFLIKYMEMYRLINKCKTMQNVLYDLTLV